MEPKIEAPEKTVRRKRGLRQIAVPEKKVKKKPGSKRNEVPEKKEKKKHRSKRGSGITRRMPIEEAPQVDDDDPFVDCDTTQRWSLERALEHIIKFQPRNYSNLNVVIKGPVTASTFECFSNSLVISLFRLYGTLEADLQNSLHIFYFGLEKMNLARFRNLTHSLHKQNIFNRFPWLTTDEKLREVVDVKDFKRKRNRRSIEYSIRKPFSEACKQYEIEKQKCSGIQKPVDVKIEAVDNTINQNEFLHNVNISNISQDNLTNNNFSVAAMESQIPATPNDKHLLLSQEYKNMISAINCSNHYNSVNESNEPQVLEEIPQSSDSSKRKSKKRSRWSFSPNETNITTEIPTLETKKIISKPTPMMHFVNRKIKLITQTPLSLGDLIVLVSYYYKLEYMEQQLLIEKMKILEATKPNQAAYLRQYVRTTCPLYNENEIQFKPLPKELIMSEINMDLYNVTCIEDILEKDFCVSEDQFQEKRIKIENTPHNYLDDVKPASKEFDFGSAFL